MSEIHEHMKNSVTERVNYLVQSLPCIEVCHSQHKKTINHNSFTSHDDLRDVLGTLYLNKIIVFQRAFRRFKEPHFLFIPPKPSLPSFCSQNPIEPV